MNCKQRLNFSPPEEQKLIGNNLHLAAWSPGRALSAGTELEVALELNVRPLKANKAISFALLSCLMAG
ncbi:MULTISPECIES: hypothetical protein [unclassified Bradyrhizobium]